MYLLKASAAIMMRRQREPKMLSMAVSFPFLLQKTMVTTQHAEGKLGQWLQLIATDYKC